MNLPPTPPPGQPASDEPFSDRPPLTPPLPNDIQAGPPVAPPVWPSSSSARPAAPVVDPAAQLWPQPPASPGPRKREGLVLAALAALAGVLVIVGALGVMALRTRNEGTSTDQGAEGVVGADEPSTTSPPTSSPATDDEQPTGSTDPSGGAGAEVEHAACPAQVPAKICDAAAFVETYRGRPFKVFPTVELVDDEAFAARLLRDFDDDRAELDITNQIWRSLGFIEPEDDLAAMLATSWEIGVVGVYFSDTKELYVEGTALDLYAEMVVVHELTHAHDDQWLDIDRPEYDDSNDEVGYGFSAVLEGNAQRVESAWRAGLSPEQESELAAQEASVLSPEDLETYLSLPRMLLLLQVSPYVDGRKLVDAIVADGGEAAVDAAITDPPITSEQVLHPDLLGIEPPIAVPTPPTDGPAGIDDGMVGELAFDLWLGQTAGDGWGGDQYVTWLVGTGACTRIDVVGDTPTDTREVESAAENWASSGDQRTLERIEIDGVDAIRITGCY